MQIVISVDEEDYRAIALYKGIPYDLSPSIGNAILSGIVLPKGHGKLKDADMMINKLCTNEASELFGSVTCAEILDFINDEKTIIEADKEYGVEVITRGNCMICGKELTEGEGLFFCKECEDKAGSRK